MQFPHDPKICYVVTIGRTIKAFFIEQLKYLSQNGFDVSIICHDDCELQNLLPKEIHLFNVLIPRGVNFFNSILALKTIYQIFREQSFDIVQYSTPNAAFIASIAAKCAKIPIRNYHIMGYRYEGEKGIKQWILKNFERCACQNSTHVECVCKATLEKGIAAKLFPKEKAVVVGAGSTGGVDTVKFNYQNKIKWRQEIRNNYLLSEKDLVFGFVGRITVDKGIHELLEAFSLLVKENGMKKIYLLLIGPAEDDNLVDVAKNNSHVILTGIVDDVERYFATLDVLVLPSYREGFGNVLIEAQTMGVPCIASDIDGPRDAMQNEITGILIPSKDIFALKDAMMDMINDEKREQYSLNALNFSKRFDSRVLCQNILTRKQNILNQRT